MALASVIDTGLLNTGACAGRASAARSAGDGVGDGALHATASSRKNGNKVCIGEVGRDVLGIALEDPRRMARSDQAALGRFATRAFSEPGGAVSENAARQPAALAPNEPSTTRSSRRTRSVDARRTHQPRHRGAEDAGPRRRVGRRDEERHSRHPLPVRWRRGHRATRTCDSSRRRWDNRSSSRRSHRVRRSTTCTCRSRCAMTLRPAAMSRMPGDPGDDAAGL